MISRFINSAKALKRAPPLNDKKARNSWRRKEGFDREEPVFFAFFQVKQQFVVPSQKVFYPFMLTTQ